MTVAVELLEHRPVDDLIFCEAEHGGAAAMPPAWGLAAFLRRGQVILQPQRRRHGRARADLLPRVRRVIPRLDRHVHGHADTCPFPAAPPGAAARTKIIC